MLFKKRGLALLRCKTVGEFRTVVRLDAFHTESEESQHKCQECCRAVRAEFFKRFDIAETAVLVYSGILIEPFLFEGFGDKWDKKYPKISKSWKDN